MTDWIKRHVYGINVAVCPVQLYQLLFHFLPYNKYFLSQPSTHSKPSPPNVLTPSASQGRELPEATIDPYYFILLERLTLPSPFCLYCTLAMIHPVPSKAGFFNPLRLLSTALQQAVGFALTPRGDFFCFFSACQCQNA